MYNKAKDIKVPTKRQISLKKLKMKQSILPEFMQSTAIRSVRFAESEFNRKNQLLRTAISYFAKELDNNPNMSNALIYTAECYKLLHEPLKAVEFYEKSLSVEPDNEYTVYNLINVYANMNYNNKKALNYINKYMLLKPDNYSIYFIQGWILNNLERYDEALLAYKKYMEKYPYSSSAILNIINIYMRKNDYKNAEIMLDKVFESQKYDEDFLIAKAEILVFNKKYAEAKEICEKLLQDNENYGFFTYPVLGAINFAQKDLQKAETDFQKALDNANFYFDIYCSNNIYEPEDTEAECYNRKYFIDNFEKIKKDYFKKFYNRK